MDLDGSAARNARAARGANLTPSAQAAYVVRRRAAGRDRQSPGDLAQVHLARQPFRSIDPIAVTDIQKIIFHLRDRGIGVLITDHNVRETLRITDRAYIVHGGVMFKSGTPATLAADEEVRAIYLGSEFRLD